ncbi:hypothetical protein [Frondihabitans peucedani]
MSTSRPRNRAHAPLRAAGARPSDLWLEDTQPMDLSELFDAPSADAA